MSAYRGKLMRLKVRPDDSKLSNGERQHLQQHFDAYAAEVIVNGEPVEWRAIDEVEVAEAARPHGFGGWFLKALYGEQRYHVGIYYGAYEAVLLNVTLAAAEYVVRTIAFYAPQPVRYSGVEGLSPLEHE